MNEPNFENLRVAAFESRRSTEMERFIEKFGGQAFVSPSMREVPLESNRQAIEFANLLLTGQIDIVIFMTGVGFKYLLDVVSKSVDRTRYLESLTDIKTVARGPKPLAAMREVGLDPTLKIPEPNTWREVLDGLDRFCPVNNRRVAIQEYGKPNVSLVAGIEARGGMAMQVPVYRWALPEDPHELHLNAQRIADQELDVLLFTSANQITNLFQVAEALQIEDEVRKQMNRIAVFSIGPTTSERLRDEQLPVDGEPSVGKMGQLVKYAAQHAANVIQRKRKVSIALTDANVHATDTSAPWYNNPFMKACRHEPTDVTPVWLMRQAGRYMQEYREIRAKTTFLDLCKNPQLCSQVMCDAVSRLGVDAAIIFSDLLPILEPMGLDLEFAKGEGPVIHNPVREGSDIDRVLELEDVNSLSFVMETVTQTRKDLPEDMPLIGFSGAPFTLASYVIEGGSSRSFVHTKTIMYRDSGAWDALMMRFVRAITKYLNAQIAAGAQCVQLFDSWAGCLSPTDYRRYALPYLKQIIGGITPGVPVINFATGNPALLPLLAEGGGNVIGVDWRISLSEAWNTVGFDKSVQGNMDPLVLLADTDTIRKKAKEVLDEANGRPGHIFNLGHGVVQQTPVENAIALVDMVHEMSAK